MTNSVNIPENFEQSEKLSTLIDSMRNALTLDRIFLSKLQNEGQNSYYLITALVNANIDPIPNEFIKLIARLEKEHPSFNIRIYTEATSETKQDDLIKAKINELIHKKQYKISPNAAESFYKTEFMITGLTDVLYDIADIMKVCIIALGYADSYFNKLIPQPNINVRTALEHILQLLPFDEMECLEEIIKENGLPYENE